MSQSEKAGPTASLLASATRWIQTACSRPDVYLVKHNVPKHVQVEAHGPHAHMHQETIQPLQGTLQQMAESLSVHVQSSGQGLIGVQKCTGLAGYQLVTVQPRPARQSTHHGPQNSIHQPGMVPLLHCAQLQQALL